MHVKVCAEVCATTDASTTDDITASTLPPTYPRAFRGPLPRAQPVLYMPAVNSGGGKQQGPASRALGMQTGAEATQELRSTPGPSEWMRSLGGPATSAF